MDFNIVTFHRANNHGAVLQAVALQEFIKQIGYSSCIYDYRPPYSGKAKGLHSRIYNICQSTDRKQFALKEKRFAEFKDKYYNLSLSNECKVFLSGSDQVWNPSGAMNPMYFLEMVKNSTYKASYSASMGVTKVPKEKETLFARYVNNFDSVSVREEEVKECISHFYFGEIHVNVDPTLLMDKAFWRQKMRPVEGLPDGYILAYILHKPKNVNKLLNWLQKELKKKIVLIDGQGMMTHLVKNDVAIHNAGPAEFLWLMDHADAVVTSSFHGTAFSIIFNKEFYAVVNPKAPSRINNILNLFRIESVSEDTTSFTRNSQVNWGYVDTVLAEQKKKSVDYLNNVYENACNKKEIKISGDISSVEKKCTGCAACQAICPTNAIEIRMNSEGFLQPYIAQDKCIHCSKCLKKCPLDKKLGYERKKAYYGWNKDKKVKKNSSSGGIFRGLADLIMKDGGIVFGTVYRNNFRSVEFANTDEVDIQELQKSKYTVSNPTGVYQKVKEQLETGRKVLFCGTPCQCAGLTQYLGKRYDNLVRCDFVCGGLASRTFYNEHLNMLEEKFKSKITCVDFRPKEKGWGRQYLHITFENGKDYFIHAHNDIYFKCFANLHVSVRSTCLDCQFYARHVSDITFADFWGYSNANVKFNKEGMSLIVANTEIGEALMQACNNLEIYPLDIKYSDYAIKCKAPSYTKMMERNEFFKAASKSSLEKVAMEKYGIGEMSHIKAYIKLKLGLK